MEASVVGGSRGEEKSPGLGCGIVQQCQVPFEVDSSAARDFLQPSLVLRCPPGVPALGFTENRTLVRRSHQGMSGATAWRGAHRERSGPWRGAGLAEGWRNV